MNKQQSSKTNIHS